MTSQFARASQIGIMQSKRNRACIRWMMPAVAAILVTLIYPLGYAFFISLRNWDVFAGTNDFIGLQNYFEVFGDKGFLVPLARTFLYMIIVVGANVVLAMTFALLANTEFPGFRIFIGLMIVPMFLIPAAGATLWRLMYLRVFGLVNHIFSFLGLQRVDFLGRAETAIYGIMMADIWSWTPFMFLVVYAGLRAIPEEPVESAKIDGASYLQVLLHVILPLISPVLVIAVTLKSINVFRTFVYVQVMTHGGPGGQSHVASTYIFESAMGNLQYGYGASMSIVMSVISAIMCLGFIRLVKSTEGKM